jgi:acyl phosphate:glycerol-3-phosphate acyltransferase
MNADAIGLAACFAAGYIAGSIPFGLFFARLAGAGDIRKAGSGNIGATNVLRVSKWAAAATLIFDAAKGAVPVLVAYRYFGDWPAVAAGAGAFIGHVFPVWLNFKGGKGVATFLGIVLAFCWQAGLLTIATWLAAAAVTRRSSLGALAAAATAWLWIILWHHPLFAWAAMAMAVLIFWTHRANIARLRAGTEPRIGAK